MSDREPGGADLLRLAAKCRRMLLSVTNPKLRIELKQMADAYEERAARD